MFKLILKYQDSVVSEYTFHSTPVSIGRREDNNVAIDNMAVSGHHATIEAEEPNYYVLVDLESLNGTFVNEKRIDRQRLFDGDSIVIGKHSFVFKDLREPHLRPKREDEAAGKEGGFKDTVFLDPKDQQAILERAAKERTLVGQDPTERPKKVILKGSLAVITSGVPQIIDLEKQVTVLGKGAEADIKCAGLLVGKKGALINKRPNGFFLSHAEGMKKPEVNGQPVTAQVQLHDGDEIVLGSTRMTFNLKEIYPDDAS
jgi:pSer/pThr/pTyr-binding forkhead associated (FHA) protein